MDIRIVAGALVLLTVYILIAFNIVHRTVAALFGAFLVGLLFYAFGLGTIKHLVEYVNHETLVLLMSMMLIVGILGRTGFFQVVAYRTAKAARGSPWMILVSLTLLTAFLSAFLDNVTTILLVLPVTLELSRALKVKPAPFILSEIFASNIGGTATLVGDPPNIMIGTYANLGFMAFMINLGPIVVLETFILLSVVWLLYGRNMKKESVLSREDMYKMENEYRITDRILYYKSIGILTFTVILFIVAEVFFHIPPAASAFTGAVFLLLLSGEDIKESLDHVEWPTLLFFTGLFIVIGGVEKMGVLNGIAESLKDLSGGDMAITLLAILWMSAFTSAIIGSIPITALMLPVVASIAATHTNLAPEPLYWALALGACLGGNGTSIASAANIVGIHIAERNGIFIDFKSFLKDGMLVTVITVGISTIYLMMRYVWLAG